MPLYLEGKIGLVSVKNIKGKDKTEDFTYYINFFEYLDKKTGDENVLEINSKEDYRSYKGENGVATVTAYKVKAQIAGKEGGYKDASLFKLSLSDFTPATGGKDRSIRKGE